MTSIFGRPAAIVLALLALDPASTAARSSVDAEGSAGIPTLSLIPAWEIPIGDTPAPFIIGVGDTFIVATPAGRVAAHGADGRGIWHVNLETGIVSEPVSGADRLVIPTEAGALVLLEKHTGLILGRIERSTPPLVTSQGSADAGLLLSAVPAGIVAGYPDGVVVLASESDGSVLWEADLRSSPSSAPAQCEEHLLVGTCGGDLIALSSGAGRIEWSRQVAKGPVTTPVTCRERRAYLGSGDNRLHALKIKRKGAKNRWSYLTGGDVLGQPLLFGDLLLFASYDTYLYAVDAGNGHLDWKVRLGRRPRDSRLLMEDLLVIAPLNAERLEAFRLPGGAKVVSVSLPANKERFVTAPVRVGDLVVVGVARYGEDVSRAIGFRPKETPPQSPPSAGAR